MILLQEEKPVKKFTGKVIAIIYPLYSYSSSLTWKITNLR